MSEGEVIVQVLISV